MGFWEDSLRQFKSFLSRYLEHCNFTMVIFVWISFIVVFRHFNESWHPSLKRLWEFSYSLPSRYSIPLTCRNGYTTWFKACYFEVSISEAWYRPKPASARSLKWSIIRYHLIRSISFQPGLQCFLLIVRNMSTCWVKTSVTEARLEMAQ